MALDDDALRQMLAANFPGVALPRPVAARLPSLLPRRRLADGRSLFVPGHKPAAFYAVAAGEIETRVTGADGTVSILEHVRPPRLFGLAAFAAGEPAEYEAVARGASEVWVIGREAYTLLMDEVPGFARALLAEPKLQALRSGHAARAWEGNCLALGSAGGCIEPLQSTGLYVVEWMLQLFADHVAPAGNVEACRARVNRVAADFFEEMRDFILAHYALSQRRDTPFWRAVTDPAALPPRLAELLALWDSKVPTPTDLDRRLSLFGTAHWSYLLAGMQRLPSHGIGLAGHISPEISMKALAHVRDIRRAASERSPTMRDYLLSLHSSVAPQAAH